MLYSSWNLVLLLTQFLAAVLILYPLKTPENLKTNGFLAFSGVRKQQYLSKTNQVRSWHYSRSWLDLEDIFTIFKVSEV